MLVIFKDLQTYKKFKGYIGGGNILFFGMLLPITVFGYTRVFLINFVSEKADKYKEMQKVFFQIYYY